ncbi:Mbov_0401 family ICE element transposase-like protein [Metamycoplasma equirhinis]|uniref:Mbov_0401 family ICE element transposase-like protein n=1 Tax=Metamycoplasma equirhinis TaxID=92402 RepID=UPI003593E2AC
MTDILEEVLKDKLKQIDLEFFNSKERIKNGWIVHSKRLIHKKLNDFEVKLQTFYYTKFDENGKQVFYNHILETAFQDDKKSTITKKLWKTIWFNSINNISFRRQSKQLNISFQSVARIWKTQKEEWLKNANEKSKLVDWHKNIENNKIDTIFISVDDTFLNSKIKGKNISKLKFRCLNFFVKNNEKKQVEMQNHLVFLSETQERKDGINKLASYIKLVINQFYSEKKMKIVILGDGATWIKNLVKILKAKYILCRFHLAQKISVIFNHSIALKMQMNKFKELYHFDFRQIFFYLYTENRYLELLVLMENWFQEIRELFSSERYKHYVNLYYYIKNNLDGLTEIKKTDQNFIGNNAESYISHLVKSKLKQAWSVFSKSSIIVKIMEQNDNISVIYN